jgi:hypothetical protein
MIYIPFGFVKLHSSQYRKEIPLMVFAANRKAVFLRSRSRALIKPLDNVDNNH